jgi:cytochrome c oxidase cbb3-type subunit 4
MDYETLRQMADSWGLLYLFVVFVGVVIFTFRPGTKRRAAEIAQIPFREDNDDK